MDISSLMAQKLGSQDCKKNKFGIISFKEYEFENGSLLKEKP